MSKKPLKGELCDSFNTDEMYELGHGNRLHCTYDFSELEFTFYDKFFNSLPNIIYKKCEDVTFCQKLYDTYEKTHDKSLLINHIDNSFLAKKNRTIDHLVQVLIRTIPKAKIIRTIQIKGLSIKEDDIIRLFSEFDKCPTLTNIYLKNLHISNDTLAKILKSKGASPYKLQGLYINNCGLTDESAQILEQYLTSKNSNKKWTLIQIELKNNDFSDQVFQRLEHLYLQAISNHKRNSKFVLSPVKKEDQNDDLPSFIVTKPIHVQNEQKISTKPESFESFEEEDLFESQKNEKEETKIDEKPIIEAEHDKEEENEKESEYNDKVLDDAKAAKFEEEEAFLEEEMILEEEDINDTKNTENIIDDLQEQEEISVGDNSQTKDNNNHTEEEALEEPSINQLISDSSKQPTEETNLIAQDNETFELFNSKHGKEVESSKNQLKDIANSIQKADLDEDNLQKENENLKAEYDQLVDQLHAMKVNDDTYLIGLEREDVNHFKDELTKFEVSDI